MVKHVFYNNRVNIGELLLNWYIIVNVTALDININVLYYKKKKKHQNMYRHEYKRKAKYVLFQRIFFHFSHKIILCMLFAFKPSNTSVK